MPASEYTAAPPTGRLKLKGVTDARVDKKKKRKRPKTDIDGDTTVDHVRADDQDQDQDQDQDGSEFKDRSVVLKHLADEDGLITKTGLDARVSESQIEASSELDHREAEPGRVSKTAAEIRFEEQRRKRLEERLKREGVKTHKQRVEELNRYLSGLSEHHDMPKIGPG